MYIMHSSGTTRNSAFVFQNMLRHVLAPLPLPLLQPFLKRVVRSAAQKRPQLFSRLGAHRNKIFLIDPVNMPFVFLLSPDCDNPRLWAKRRMDNIPHDARIAGTFLTLLGMIDGRLDGDALFFTRDLQIEGDTEAVICLRNALDDLEDNIMDDIAGVFGTVGRTGLSIIRRVRE